MQPWGYIVSSEHVDQVFSPIREHIFQLGNVTFQVLTQPDIDAGVSENASEVRLKCNRVSSNGCNVIRPHLVKIRPYLVGE